MNPTLSAIALKLICITLIWSLNSSSLLASSKEQPYTFPQALENIQYVNSSEVFYVRYTNNAWRNESKALWAVLESMMQQVPDKAWNITIEKHGVPYMNVKASQADVREACEQCVLSTSFIKSLQISYDIPEKSIFRDAPLTNRSAGKTDVILYPQFLYANNTFDKIWETQFNLAPAIETNLWRGALLTAQVIFPLYNDMYSKEAAYIRPGFLTLSQTYRLPANITGQIAVGNFSSNRIGIFLSNNWLSAKGHWSVGYQASLTGSSYFDYGEWSVSSWKRVSAHLQAAYTPDFYNMEFQVSAGRYIFGDYGAQATITRRFPNAAIQVMGRYSGDVFSAGLSVTFPMWLRKQSRAGIFRAKVTDWYFWSFTERSGSKADKYTGRSFAVSPDASPLTNYLNPVFMRNELLRLTRTKSQRD